MNKQRKTRKVQENHGMTRTPIHKIWAGMVARCRHEPNYINKGIEVCDEWKESFLAFYRDMGDRPTPQHQLDRRDPWGNYCKENCRWLLPKENSRNKTNQAMLTFNGKTLCIADWADITGTKATTIYSRLNKGWSVEKVLTTDTSRGKLSETEAAIILTKLGAKSLIGSTFGKLQVVSLHNRYTSGENAWLCLCECGVETVVRNAKLIKLKIVSCGCDVFYNSDGTRKADPPNHLPTQTPEYQAWSGIKLRCSKLKNYIARGITMHKEWEDSYEAFLTHLKNTIGLKPAKGYALDRCDNNAGYIPFNLKWSTVKENNRNKSNTRYLTYEGVTQSVAAWAELLDVDTDTLYSRLNRGWSIEETLTKSVRKQKANYKHSR